MFENLILLIYRFETLWTTWKNVEGQTASIRQHLRGKHGKVWRDVVVLRQLKGWKEVGAVTLEDEPREWEPFSLAGFYERLVKWVAVDDQVCPHVVHYPITNALGLSVRRCR